MSKVFCKHCGTQAATVSALTAMPCLRNPNGKKHEIYEGSEKSRYCCKHCGTQAPTISALTAMPCLRNPHGKKRHEPAL